MALSSGDPAARPVPLGEVAAATGGAVLGDALTPVLDLTQDSRRVVPGGIFAVRRGQRSDGRAFVSDALARGASALLVDDPALAQEAGVPALIVDDVRRAIGQAAAAVHRRPFDRLKVVGVTGTNGKTTTTHLIASALGARGARPGVLGTLGTHFEGVDLGGSHTTPEADEVTRMAATLLGRGATHLVMEVSSHALALSRVEEVRFEAAGFTNLTHDHLDLHGTFEAYGEAKARLFTDLSPRASVINVDDPFGLRLLGRAAGERWGVSRRGDEAARLRVVEARAGADGVDAQLTLDGRPLALRSALVGAHNLENLLVALGLCLGLGLEAAEAALALGAAPAVPGRLERCSEPGDDVLVLVDYAHTPDALSRVLAALRPLCQGELWCVFGCGGDRDPHKRGPMGEAVARGADRRVVTNDNPRSEPPEIIAAAIVDGVHRAGAGCEVELDRSRAIERSVRGAAPGDVVLIAGKGHEPYQIVGSVSRPFDDRAEARRALALRRGR